MSKCKQWMLLVEEVWQRFKEFKKIEDEIEKCGMNFNDVGKYEKVFIALQKALREKRCHKSTCSQCYYDVLDAAGERWKKQC